MNSLSPSSRYILPQFEERTPHGTRTQDPYSRLFRDRIIFLGTQIDEISANDIMSQLLVLEAIDAEQSITMYINSPGGSFSDMTAIYDTMQHIKPDVATVCLGKAVSSSAILLAGGTKGMRAALPNARIVLDQPAVYGNGRGQASDINIQASEIKRTRTWIEETLADITGQSVAKIAKDVERNFYLSAQEALEYGIIDEVLTK
jgi:ATP-dependent Clp protease protease subunit